MKTPKEQAIKLRLNKKAKLTHQATISTQSKAQTNHEDTKGTSNTSRKHKKTTHTYQTTIIT